MTASGKLKVGYFTQYQVEELDGEDTPLEHMTPADAQGARPARCAPNWAGSAFRATRRRCRSEDVGRRAGAAGAGADHPRRAAHADPRRADQPSRRRCARGSGPGAERLFGRGRRGQPRPPHARADRRPAGAGRRRHRDRVRRQPRRLYRPHPRQERRRRRGRDGRRRRATARTAAAPPPKRASAARRCARPRRPPRRRSPGWKRARPSSSAPCSTRPRPLRPTPR